MCGAGDKQCAVCEFGSGCLVSMREDNFIRASKRTLIERLNNNKYPRYRQLMIDTLKSEYNHNYIYGEDLPELRNYGCCCTTIRASQRSS